MAFYLPTWAEHSQLTHIMYRQMERMGEGDLYVLAPDWHFQEYTRHPAGWLIHQPFLREQFAHSLPTQRQLDNLPHAAYPPGFVDQYLARWRSETIAHNYLQEIEEPCLTAWIIEQVKAARRDGRAEGFFSWRDCASLQAAADSLGLPVIYGELGPFRGPTCHETCFFDFSGVKKSDEPQRRFELIRADSGLRKQYEQWSETLFPSLFERPRGGGCATLLACEEDFAFMSGFSNYRLLALALEKYPTNEIIARPHPMGRNVRYLDLSYDDSPNLSFVLERCARALTVYSNGGVELLAKGLSVEFTGVSPLSFLSAENMPDRERAWKIGFFALNYLIPGELMFTGEYFRWRLAEPPEQEIFERHAEYWRRHIADPKGKKVFSREGGEK